MKPAQVGHAMRRRFGMPSSTMEMANAPKDVQAAVAAAQKYSNGQDVRPHVEDWRAAEVRNG